MQIKETMQAMLSLIITGWELQADAHANVVHKTIRVSDKLMMGISKNGRREVVCDGISRWEGNRWGEGD
jgi:hypothetical protein